MTSLRTNSSDTESTGDQSAGRAASLSDEQSASDGPLVSVVIATYNRPTYLRAAIESVQAQTYTPIELVVVDDHSTEPAEGVVEEVSTGSVQSVQCIRHEENRGANAARNTGVRAASGAYIAFLDDDDRWVPDKIERQVATLQQADDAGLVYTGITKVYADDTHGGTDTEIDIPPEITGNMTKALLCRNVVGTLSTIMVRADLARSVPFDEQFPCWADLEWYINVSMHSTFVRLPEPLVEYEFTAHNRLSDDYEKKRAGYERFIGEFDHVATQYGRLFRRKMRGWAAYRTGFAAMETGRYDEARQLLTTAVLRYPLEPKFYKYWLATLGGRYTHELARTATNLLS